MTLDRKEHDKAVLTDLADWLEKLDLVDEDEREGARKNITVMVETLLSRLYTATAPSGQAPLEGVKTLHEYRIAGQCNCGDCLRIRQAGDNYRSALLPASAEPVKCVACEDSPKAPNIPCAVCGASPPASGAVEAGWQLVPKEPTPTMEHAALVASRRADFPVLHVGYDLAGAALVYKAMLSAAPTEGR